MRYSPLAQAMRSPAKAGHALCFLLAEVAKIINVMSLRRTRLGENGRMPCRQTARPAWPFLETNACAANLCVLQDVGHISVYEVQQLVYDPRLIVLDSLHSRVAHDRHGDRLLQPMMQLFTMCKTASRQLCPLTDWLQAVCNGMQCGDRAPEKRQRRTFRSQQRGSATSFCSRGQVQRDLLRGG